MNLRTKRQFGALALTLLLASATSACGSDEAPTSADGPTKVTLSIPPVGDSLPVYDAIAKGYFAAEGLDVELRPAANGATTINALVSGSTDLALVSYPSLITARSSGMPVTIAAPAIAGTEEYASGLYVLADSDIKKPADMVGKKMATPSLGSVGDVWFRGELLQEGLDPGSVTYVEIPQANMAAALKAGDVDGIFQTEPTLSATQASLDIRLVDYQEGPQGLFATSATFLKDQPGAVAGFRAALAKAVADIEADPRGVATAMMPKYTKMTAEVAAKMRLPQYQVDYDAAGVQSVIDLMVKVGLLKASFKASDLYQDVT
ncbi:ABC transporter substrate-binding protein [Nonomuraea gerenzanensis]|uniref:Putative extracellular solute-binding protein n=1 Tax=Nonomuraea gerenzanensis TaxID=93944 RepID=A0A1M4EC95_9ACTN|nr:ABC transporter substrate-binding protein [Nonomuraea gerenzanensis]UBU18717.1 ABC transporter substrate-binding protein [Nonomuraea gerenzanensis]SBO96577.1 putative extracellular solute-binding protein [Nonomuraea gerenzanensis]